MADMQFNPENKELQGQGLRAYELQDYETACRIYSNVSELLFEKHKDVLHDELGDVYLQYGQSLLKRRQYAVWKADAINDGVIKNVPEDDDDEDQEEEGGEEEQGDDEEGGEEGEQGDEEEGGKGDEEADEDASDLQLAWKVLKLAKKIFFNRGDAGLEQHAETLVVLGEVALESCNYKRGIDLLVEGLGIQKTLFPKDSKIVAATCFILGSAYSLAGQISNSIASYKECLKIVEKRLANLKAANSKDKDVEIEKIEGLIPRLKEKVTDMLNFKEYISSSLKRTLERALDKM